MLFEVSCSSGMLTSEARKVQSYIPENAVIAHRGTIYWAPELTEPAYRWARNTGADYLELDVQRSSDGVLIVMHDKTFKRTTDVAEKFPGRENDPVSSFTYEEISRLDAGTSFNIKNPERSRGSYTGQDVLVLDDVFHIAGGMRIKRDADGRRLFSRDEQGIYTFEYEVDPADNGNRPGVFIETKVPENFPGIEEQIYADLTAIGWNPLEGEAIDADAPFIDGGKVNIGNTRGKILLQSFSLPGMENLKRVFRQEVPCSFLVTNPKTNDFSRPGELDSIIKFTVENGGQFIGTNLGDENDGLPPLFARKLHEAGLKANIYSINTPEQMEKYFGQAAGSDASPLADGMITNRAELTIDFYNSKGVRQGKTETAPEELLEILGYRK